MKIAIVGGAIAGSTISIGLSRLGHDVSVFERSSSFLKDRGAGIALPKPLVEKLIELDFVDADMQTVNLMSMEVLEKVNDEQRIIAEMPAHALGLNWGELYAQLNKRLGADQQHFGTFIDHFVEKDKQVIVDVNGKQQSFDLLIACDGYKSSFRQYVSGQAKAEFAGYVAWRGLVTPFDDASRELAQAKGFKHAVFKTGQLVLYPICRQGTSEKLLNWGMYELVSEANQAVCMTDKKGRLVSSLAKGTMRQDQIEHVYTLAKENLPSTLADAVLAAPEPYMQGIYDINIEQYVRNRVCLLGDAAIVARPHTGSGSAKAMQDALALIDAITQTDDIDQALSSWQSKQQEQGEKLFYLGRELGSFLVEDDIDWHSMTSENYQTTIAALAKKYAWYIAKK